MALANYMAQAARKKKSPGWRDMSTGVLYPNGPPTTGKPYSPLTTSSAPPPGSYDPALDASERAAQRGYGDLVSDYGKGGRYTNRATDDYTLAAGGTNAAGGRVEGTINQAARRGTEDLATGFWRGQADYNTQQARGTADLGTQRTGVQRDYGRSLADLMTGQQRETQDYGTSTENVNRSYQRLGVNQEQAARQAGVDEGGTLAAALQARKGNQALDQAPLDTAHQRATEDYGLRTGRLGEDRQTALTGIDTAQGRLNEDVTQGRGRLTEDATRGATRTEENRQAAQGQAGITYGRTQQDYNTQVARGRRELGQYEGDINAQRWYSTTGLAPTQADVNTARGQAGEKWARDASGNRVVYRTVPGRPNMVLLPDGRIVSRSHLLGESAPPGEKRPRAGESPFTPDQTAPPAGENPLPRQKSNPKRKK